MLASPLVWLHFQFSGAWRRNLTLVGLYLLVGLVGSSVFYRLAGPANSGEVSSGWLGFVTIFQSVFALLLAPSSIHRAIRNDFQNGMIESHRLTPMSGFGVVSGYLLGPPIQAAALFFAGILLGTYFAADLARSLTPAVVFGWYALQVCILCLGFMLASLVLLVSLTTSGKINLVGFVILAGMFGWMIIRFIPGLGLAGGVFTAGVLIEQIFSATLGGGGAPAPTGDPAVIAVSMLCQVVLAAILIAAACRKVRGIDQAMFGIRLGLLLVITWAAILVLGIVYTPVNQFFFESPDGLAIAQLVSSGASLMLVALFPLTGAAVATFQADRITAFAAAPRRSSRLAPLMMPWVLALLSGLTVLLMARFMQPYLLDATFAGFQRYALLDLLDDNINRLVIVAVFLLSFATDYCVVYAALAFGRRPLYWLIAAIVAFKGLPIFAAGIWLGVQEELTQMDAGSLQFSDQWIAGFSPIGTLCLVMLPGGKVLPGLIGQLVLLGLMVKVAALSRQRLLRRPAAARPVPEAA